MGEYVAASLRLGGKLKAEFVPDLVELYKAQEMTTQDEDEDPSPTNLGETFFNAEINYGNLDDLMAFAYEHKLDYVHWCDSGPDWMAFTDKNDFELVGSANSDFYISEYQLKELGVEGALAKIAWMREPLPALEIVP